MKRIGLLLVLLLCGATPALAASGVQGRVAWRGELVAGVQVHAYRAVADIPAGRDVAVSAPVDVDGSYRLELAPGEYYLVARDFDGPPKPGGHFCYYSGAPVRVVEGAFTNVGFNLIRIPAEAAVKTGDASGIEGEITFQGQPLDRCYLYVYGDPSQGFKGPGYVIQPVEKGSFRLRLPPGEYWILARKRAKGGRFGPIEIGDYFNFYHGNPVRIAAGEMHEVKIETITRLEMLEKSEVPFRGVEGQVVGPGGEPAAGLRVFAYREDKMTGTPVAMSAPTAADGRFRLSLGDDGPWYLLARQELGGPAGAGELYGRYGGSADHSLTLGEGDDVREVTIHVAAKRTD